MYNTLDDTDGQTNFRYFDAEYFDFQFDFDIFKTKIYLS